MKRLLRALGLISLGLFALGAAVLVAINAATSALFSPAVAPGQGCSRMRRSVLPYRCLSDRSRNLNVASASIIIRTNVQAKTTPLVSYACFAAAAMF